MIAVLVCSKICPEISKSEQLIRMTLLISAGIIGLTVSSK